MDGAATTFIQELLIKTGQSRSSRLLMETVLVVSPLSHGMIGEISLTSATTTRFSSISHVAANSTPNTLEQISGAVRIMVLYLVEVSAN